MPPRRVLILGGAGFLGSGLAEEMLSRNYHVSVVDRLSHGPPCNLHDILSRIDLYPISVGSPDFWTLLEKGGYDVVFHFAGRGEVYPSVTDPRSDFAENLLTGFDILEFARQKQMNTSFVFASSVSVYGLPARLPIDEADSALPLSPYGVSKLALEHYAAVYSRLYDLRTTSLRFFSLYGPRQRKLVIYDLIRRFDTPGEMLPIFGDGSQIRDFCYVKDAVRAARLVWERGALRGEAYNIGTGSGTSIREIAERIRDLLRPGANLKFTGSVRPGEGQAWVADIGRARQLGYVPEWGIDAGLRETVEWYRESRSP